MSNAPPFEFHEGCGFAIPRAILDGAWSKPAPLRTASVRGSLFKAQEAWPSSQSDSRRRNHGNRTDNNAPTFASIHS
jgi:hypothetical protein